MFKDPFRGNMGCEVAQMQGIVCFLHSSTGVDLRMPQTRVWAAFTFNGFFTTKNLQLVYPPLWQGPLNENPCAKLRLGHSKVRPIDNRTEYVIAGRSGRSDGPGSGHQSLCRGYPPPTRIKYTEVSNKNNVNKK